MARRHRPHSHHGEPAEGPSQRQLRVGEVVRHVLADIFVRGDLQDPELQGADLTVGEVRVSPDMRHATVFVMRLGGGDMKPVMEGLARARGYLRSQVGRALTTKFTPDLTFVEDTSFDTAQHVLEILRSDEVKRDLDHDEGEDGEDNSEDDDGAA
jgi:ribosome-binding factor A